MQTAVQEQTQPSLLRDFVMLTKPRIISLLLVTTIAPMFVAGDPHWTLVLVVFVAGYMMAGGANAVNMYLDRDIDDRMARTRLRPLPSGRMHTREVLAFGLLLATGATFLLARYVNVLSAALALGGFYSYVFLYTRWLKRSTPQNIVIGGAAGAFPPLGGGGGVTGTVDPMAVCRYTRGLKRSTPQNIVIGGAAGAFPPLVGWAAVTGTIDLMAVYLFLIVFYWTPPHFWALALNKQRDYGRAGVPMAPLVWGTEETKRQMLWYSVILIALTALPWAMGSLGVIYLVSAGGLGAIVLHGVWRGMRAGGHVRTARGGGGGAGRELAGRVGE